MKKGGLSLFLFTRSTAQKSNSQALLVIRVSRQILNCDSEPVDLTVEFVRWCPQFCKQNCEVVPRESRCWCRGYIERPIYRKFGSGTYHIDQTAMSDSTNEINIGLRRVLKYQPMLIILDFTAKLCIRISMISKQNKAHILFFYFFIKIYVILTAY